MNLLDLIIIIFLLLMLARGIHSGFLRPLLSSAGFLGGLIIGSWLAGRVAPFSSEPLSKFIIIIAVELALASLFFVLGETAGYYLDRLAWRHHLGLLDEGLGAALAVVFALGVVWLGASAMVNVPAYGIGRQVRQSLVARSLNAILPTPPDVFARLEKIISPNGFPNVFLALEPQHTTVSPFNSVSNEAVIRDEASVVKVEGKGCGGIIIGSGFVVAEGMVVTSAHVVAGIDAPRVLDAAGSYAATPIWFDPDKDVAVLRAQDLQAPPLRLADATLQDRDAAAVLGFPGGGPLVVTPAVIIDRATATGRNIYNRGLVFRDIYEAQAAVERGNSGGPLVGPDGAVAGIVFGTSVSQDNVAYALRIEEFRTIIQEAIQTSLPVSTGGCAYD